MSRVSMRPLLLLAALAGSLGAQAAQLDSVYTPESGTSWTVAFTLANDGAPPLIGGMTAYFSEQLFANLQLVLSPATWDSIVIQPDTGIPAAGFLDSAVIDSSLSLLPGQSLGGFVVRFDYLGLGAPGSLPFDIVDANFQVLFSGQSVASVVPEPAVWLQLLAGFGLLATGLQRRAAAAGLQA